MHKIDSREEMNLLDTTVERENNIERLAGGPLHDEYFSTNIHGLIRNIKNKLTKLNVEDAIRYLSQSGTKRTEIKRTLIGIQKSS